VLATRRAARPRPAWAGGWPGRRPRVRPGALRDWASGAGDSYLRVVTALALNVPLLFVVLARHLEGVAYSGLAGVYAHLVFLGYYALILLALVSVTYAVTMFWRRFAVFATGAVVTAALFYLVVNSIVHGIYRFHIDAFWIQYLLTSYSGLGIPPSLLAVAVGILIGIAALEWGAFRLARRLRRRKAVAIAFACAAVASFAVSQAIHVVAYYKNDTRITGITPQLPYYFPVTSHGEAVKYGGLMPMVADPGKRAVGGAVGALHYPLSEVHGCPPAGKKPTNVLLIVLESWRFDMMNPEVSPHMHRFSQRASVFLRHFSSGNSTPTGIFGLFYGIHPTYWTAVKANSASIDNPVLIDVMKDNGYDFGIFANSDFSRHKIKDTVFRGIDVQESFAGASHDLKDRDMTERLIAFMERDRRAGKPFFGFAFYKSTHYSYYYPESSAHFRPSQKLNIGFAGRDKSPTLYLNDYRNSIRWVDDLLGEVIDRLDSSGLLDHTMVIITSDHGEEFNDNHANYWGHCSNFTEYQTRVPMIVYLPGHMPRQVTETTSHIDIPATVLAESFGCDRVADYGNGLDLFGPLPAERPLVISSYVNHAFIIGDDVYAVFPMYVQKYKLNDIAAETGPPRPDLVKEILDEMNRFYGSGSPHGVVADAGAAGARRLRAVGAARTATRRSASVSRPSSRPLAKLTK
jgi:uncharacterized protein